MEVFLVSHLPKIPRDRFGIHRVADFLLAATNGLVAGLTKLRM